MRPFQTLSRQTADAGAHMAQGKCNIRHQGHIMKQQYKFSCDGRTITLVKKRKFDSEEDKENIWPTHDGKGPSSPQGSW